MVVQYGTFCLKIEVKVDMIILDNEFLYCYLISGNKSNVCIRALVLNPGVNKRKCQQKTWVLVTE